MPSLAAESPVATIATFDDVWEDLLNFVEEKQVIPIVGPELVSVQTDAGWENLYAWLARSLETRLGLAAGGSAQPPTLNDVVVRHLANRGRARMSTRASAPSCARRPMRLRPPS